MDGKNIVLQDSYYRAGDSWGDAAFAKLTKVDLDLYLYLYVYLRFITKLVVEIKLMERKKEKKGARRGGNYLIELEQKLIEQN